MDSAWLEKVRDLRAEAWDALMSSPDFIAFKTFDDAVVSLGGAPILAMDSTPLKDVARRVVEAAGARMTENKKLSQGDAAEMVLNQRRIPLSLADLLNGAIEKGAEIGGADPVSNFRSSISKDKRFRSVTRNGKYFWWLVDVPMPPATNETGEPDLLDGSPDSSVPSSQEGGEGNAPATT
jgi:hypothetical protein